MLNRHLILLSLLLQACGGDTTPSTSQNLQTPPPVDNASVEFESLFSFDNVKTIRIRISDAEWNALLNDYDNNPRNEVYRRADFFYSDRLVTNEHIANVGFRLRGNSFSRDRPERGSGRHRPTNPLVRVHYKIKFNERFDEDESAYGPPSRDIDEIATNRGRLFRGVRSLNLKHNRIDRSYLREVFTFDVLRRFGIKTHRQAYTRLYIRIGSESERYLGVYAMAEALDSSWVRRTYGQNAFLFKCLWQATGPADLSRPDRSLGANSGRIGQEITDPVTADVRFDDYRPSYDLKTRDGDFLEAEQELNGLIRLLTGNPSQQQLAAALDVTSILKSQAVAAFVGKWDGYWRNGNNYYLLKHPMDDRWVFIPYDHDLGFDDNFFDLDIASNLAEAPFDDWGEIDEGNVQPLLMRRLLAVDQYRAEYLNYVRLLADENDGLLHPNNARARLLKLQELIVPYTRNYEALEQTTFIRNFNILTNFLTRRVQTAQNELN